MKKQYYITLILIGLLSMPGVVFGYTVEFNAAPEEKTTIREMQADIQILKNKKHSLDAKWNNFQIGSEKLTSLIRTNLSERDRVNLEDIIDDYFRVKKRYESKLSSKIDTEDDTRTTQADLIAIKQQFYTDLVPYIQVSRLKDFTHYVNQDLKYNEKSKVVAVEIEKKHIEKKERLEELKQKIQDHSEQIRTSLREKLTIKLESRLEVFINSEIFLSLPSEGKVQVFKNLITKIESLKTNLKSNPNTTSVAEEKFLMYEVLQEILEEHIRQWN